MPTYIVEVEYAVFARIEIEADSADAAQYQLELAYYSIPGNVIEQRHDPPTVYAVTEAAKQPQQ